MINTYELKLDKFSGPLDALLELIETRKLEISEISLAQVTDDFLQYLKAMSDKGETDSFHMRTVADFIVIASRLIFIKSKSLLPELQFGDEDEAEIKDLEERLKAYQALKPAMKMLAELWKKRQEEFGRPYFLSLQNPVFYPSPAITPQNLMNALAKILEVLEKLAVEEVTVKDHVLSLENRIKEIIAHMKELAHTSFKELSSSSSRGEMIVTFIALLHLAREQLIFLEQGDNLSDIIIRTSAT